MIEKPFVKRIDVTQPKRFARIRMCGIEFLITWFLNFTYYLIIYFVFFFLKQEIATTF